MNTVPPSIDSVLVSFDNQMAFILNEAIFTFPKKRLNFHNSILCMGSVFLYLIDNIINIYLRADIKFIIINN